MKLSHIFQRNVQNCLLFSSVIALVFDICCLNKFFNICSTANSSNSFLVERIGSMKCIAPEWNNELLTYHYSNRETCNVSDSSQRWIWTPNNQLMHVNALKCLQQGFLQFIGSNSGNSYFNLVLEECMSTQTEQLWQCLGQKSQNFVNSPSKTYMYMYQRSKRPYIYATNGDKYSERLKWHRLPSNQSLCSKGTSVIHFLPIQ